MGERCARWVRVSTADQSERNQVPSINGWIAGHGYEVGHPDFALNDRSAFKGEQQQQQDAAVEAIRAGEFTVLVGWAADRFERRGIEATLSFARRVAEAGGRIECSDDHLMNAASTGDLGPALAAWMANQESKRKQARVKAVNAAIDATGGFRGGRVPFGYAVRCGRCGKLRCADKAHRRTKAIVPDPVTAPVVGEAFTRIAEGQNVPRVSAWLASLGYRKNISSIVATVRRSVYWTGNYRVTDHAGVARVHRVQALVSPEVWQAAQEALAARPSTNPHRRRPDSSDWSGALFCAVCGGAVYRNWNGRRKLDADGKRRATRVYYCRPCGKGTMDAATADEQVERIMSGDTSPEMAEVIIPGSNYAAELERVRAELRDLGARNLPDAEEDAERARLRAERTRLQGLPVEAARRERTFTGRTRGQAWDAMSHGERVAYLRSGEFRLVLSGRGADVKVTRVWLDDPAEAEGSAS